MMSLLGLRSAIVASIESEISTLRTVKTHGGRFDAQELKRWALIGPAVLITVVAVDNARNEAGQAVGDIKCVAFIITAGTSVIKRDASAMAYVESLMALAAKNSWSYSDAQAPSEIAADNLYSGVIDKLGVALWSVTWTQSLDFEVYDPTSLDDFNTMHTDFDLTPLDGVVDANGFLQLQGAFMSAYGQMYISTAVATGIAVIGTFQKAAGTTVLMDNADMDMPVSNRLRHTGATSKPFVISASITIIDSGNSKVSVVMAKNGTVDTTTTIERDCTAGDAQTFSIQDIVSLDTNDYVEVWVTADATDNITFSKLNLTAAAA